MEIDIAAIEKELSLLSPEEQARQLLDAKVNQKYATKKYYNPETAKRARQKKAAELKALAERAKQMKATKPGFENLFEQINAEAEELANQKLEAEFGDQVQVA